MAEHSCQSSSHLPPSLDHLGRSQRLGIKHVHHPWHGEALGLSHFEDFMLEIGVDPEAVHLCCVPRPEMKLARHMHKRSNSTSDRKATRRENTVSDYHTSNHDRTRSFGNRTRPSCGPEFTLNQPQKLVSQPQRIKPPVPPIGLSLIAASKQHLKAFASSAIEPSNFSGSFATLGSATAARDTLLAISINYSISQPSYHEPAHPEPTDHLAWPSDIPQSSVQLLSSEPIPSAPSTSTLTTRSRASSITSLATASSSEGPVTPRAHSPLMSPSPELHRSLSDLEHSSRFRIPTRCITCNRAGSNFPCCPKCGDMWCSRHCRMEGGKDGRHSCHCTTMEPSIVYA